MNIVRSKGRRVIAAAVLPISILVLEPRLTFAGPFGHARTVIAENSKGEANYLGDNDDLLSRQYGDGENQSQMPPSSEQNVQAPAVTGDLSYMNTPPNFNSFENYDELTAPNPSQAKGNQLEPPQNYDPGAQPIRSTTTRRASVLEVTFPLIRAA